MQETQVSEAESKALDLSSGLRWGIGLFSACVMLYELGLTRLLSVAFYYHTAFFALSVALLGLGAGGLAVDQKPSLSRLSPAFWITCTGLCAVLPPVFLRLFRVDPVLLDRPWQAAFFGLFSLLSLGCFLPFFCAGVVWALWFRRYARQAGRLYAWDLGGAALGALALVPALDVVGGPAILLLMALCMVGAAEVVRRSSPPPQEPSLFGGVGRLCSLGVVFGLCVLHLSTDVFELAIDVGIEGDEKKVFYKRWNAFSRVVVLPQQDWDRGLSKAGKARWAKTRPRQMDALIDINAFAPIVRFDGDLTKLEFLKDLVSNLAYRIKPPKQEVLILGPGGGKDILGALVYDPARVTGIELNPILIDDLLKDRLRDFAGALLDDPRVRVVVGEGRATLERLDETFDILIANSVFTWAAHSSGAMNLAEHSLYTKEACALYWKRLRPGGIVSISVWDAQGGAIPLRWIATCEAALSDERGRPVSLQRHTAIVANPWSKLASFTTVLLQKSPFSPAQSQTLLAAAAALGFQVHYLPRYPVPSASTQPSKDAERPASTQPSSQTSKSPTSLPSLPLPLQRRASNAPKLASSQALFERLFADPQGFSTHFRDDISPVTDDRPFFLYTLRMSDILRLWKKEAWDQNAALASLLIAFLVIGMMVLLTILLPFWRRPSKEGRLSWRWIGFFGGIGAGFFFVEIPLIQRLTLFLGHPTYALTVVLAGLLFWSGLGSFWIAHQGSVPRSKAHDPQEAEPPSPAFDAERLRRLHIRLLLGTLLALVAFVWGLPLVLKAASGFPTWGRILLCLGGMGPLGVLLGAALPLGIMRLEAEEVAAVPWAWAINASCGVFASVAALGIAAVGGFSWAFTSALGCYALAAVCAGLKGDFTRRAV